MPLSDRKHPDELKAYRITFTVNGRRHSWIRFYCNLEFAFADTKEIAIREYPKAHKFMIESDQGDIEIRKSWGLDF